MTNHEVAKSSIYKRSQSQKITYSMNPFIWNVQSKQPHTDRSKLVNYQELAERVEMGFFFFFFLEMGFFGEVVKNVLKLIVAMFV